MEIGVSTASYFNCQQTEDAILDIGSHGVSLCEIFLNSFCEYRPEFIEMLRARLVLSGLRVFSIHPMSTQFEPMLFSLHPRQRKDAWDLYETVLQGARTLGATHYVMHGPANLSGAAKNLQIMRITPIFRDLIALACSYGVTLTLENVSWCVFHHPSFGVALRDAIGDHSLKFTLDVKQAIRSGNTPLAFIDAVGDDIANLHLCDATIAADGAYSLQMPGQGEVDFSAIARGLLNHGYTGPAFIEVYSDMYQNIAEIYESRSRMLSVLNA